MTDYDFVITLKDGETINEIIEFERPRTGKGTYKKVKGVYVQDGFEKEYTRYLSVSDEGYYVWIPRYQYILNRTNPRVEIKFMQVILI